MMDKNYNPLNPMVDQVQKFLDQKQVPKEQVVPFLMSLGYRGLAGAVAGRMRLDQASQGVKALQQAQGQAPAPPNVMQENEMKTQQLQQGIQQALAPRNPTMAQAAPNIRAAASGGIMRLAGGGPIAFQAGGLNDLANTLGAGDRPIPYSSSSARPALPGDIGSMRPLPQGYGSAGAFEELEELFRRAPDPSTKQIIIERAKQTLSSPAFKKWAGRVGIAGAIIPTAKGYMGLTDDPAELAREYGMDPEKFGRKTAASGLAYLENIADIPTLGTYGMLRGETPQERVQAKASKAEKARNIETEDFASFMAGRRTPEQIAAQQEYSEAIREFGANSQQAKIAEEKYRRLRGRASVADEAALDKLLAESAAGGRETSASQIGAPRLPGVPTTARETKALTELRGRLAGMEDVSKPEAREAAIDREMAARMKRYTDMGILKPFDDAKANVQGRLKELEGIKDKNFYKAMAMMGFTMASTRGSFFQALAAGGAAGLSAYETFEEKRQATLDKLQDRMTSIDMNIANIKERAGAGAEARVDKLESDRKNLENQITTLQSAQETLAQTQSFQLALADRQIAADAARDEGRYGGLQRQIESEIMQLRELRTKRPELRNAIDAQIKRKMDELTEAVSAKTGSVLAAQVRANASGITGYPYPTIDSEKGGDDPFGVNALVAQYGQ
jgi:hypothetical protein